MTHDQVREALDAEINRLITARDALPQGDERKATSAQIERLFDEVSRINITVAGQLGAKVDAIIAKIEEVVEAENLDAASALGRSANRLRQRLEELNAPGGQ